MEAIPVIIVFDVGKTNKKVFVFDEHYKIVFERTARFKETTDEDGDPCENLESLKASIYDTLHELFKRPQFVVKAVNFSAYGASLVYIDTYGNPLTPLYNYLKDYPEELQQDFYQQYGDKEEIALATASPVSGSLNSGMQLYRIKKEKPELYQQIKYAIHLPQYLSYLVSGIACSELTSIGCHTQLWDFAQNKYHDWVEKEGLVKKMPPILAAGQIFSTVFEGTYFQTGLGLHDSSAALIPYLFSFQEPFVLISTGTWCISLNPFNDVPLTKTELGKNCLCYLQYQGKPVKASRLFAGYEHDQQLRRIAGYFKQGISRYRTMPYHAAIADSLIKEEDKYTEGEELPFIKRNLSHFSSDTIAYHQLILDIAVQQHASTKLVMADQQVKRIFVDGGFSKNEIYMNLMARMFPDIAVFAASVAQATAIGAALAIHKSWNAKPMPNDLIELKYYAIPNSLTL